MLDADVLLDMPGAATRSQSEEGWRFPAQPKNLRDTGLDHCMVVDLVAKAIFQAGKAHLPVLSGQLRLSVNVLREVLDFMQADRLVETTWRGDTDLDVQYQLTGAGKQHASECMARCRYVGPAPVTLQAYRDVLHRQSGRHPSSQRLAASDLQAAFADDCIDPSVRDMVGAAVHAGRSLLLYGPSGAGKTTLALKLGRLQQGIVAVPYAIVVEQQIIQVYDPQVHLQPSPLHLRQHVERRSLDARWAQCQRPVVVTRGVDEGMLELRRDGANGVYHAPPQVLANGGMLLVDDLGAEPARGSAVLNRLANALAAGADQVAVQGSHALSIPFDAMTVFATSADPCAAFGHALMRRVAYKVHVGPLDESSYRMLFRQQCRVAGVSHDDVVADYLVSHLHTLSHEPLLACYPRELLARIGEFASYAGMPARLTIPALEQAWNSMFTGELTAEA